MAPIISVVGINIGLWRTRRITMKEFVSSSFCEKLCIIRNINHQTRLSPPLFVHSIHTVQLDQLRKLGAFGRIIQRAGARDLVSYSAARSVHSVIHF